MMNLITRKCWRKTAHESHEYLWSGLQRWCPGKAESGKPGESTYYVVLIIADDGAPSVVGTPAGRPFRSEESAQEIADLYPESEGFATNILQIESCEK